MLEVGWLGGLKRFFQKHLKTGDGQRQKLFVGGGGFEGVTIPAPPPPRKILIIHLVTGVSEKSTHIRNIT